MPPGPRSPNSCAPRRGKPQVSQDEIIELVAGPPPTSPQRAQIREEIANRMRLVLEAQRLVSLDTLLAWGMAFPRWPREKPRPKRWSPLPRSFASLKCPSRSFPPVKNQWTTQHFGDTHTLAEMDTNIIEALRAPGSPKELANARGRLVPFLRDFLIGLNYAYYEPPGAQMLHHNPLFIRRHDFSGDVSRGSEPPGLRPSWSVAAIPPGAAYAWPADFPASPMSWHKSNKSLWCRKTSSRSSGRIWSRPW